MSTSEDDKMAYALRALDAAVAQLVLIGCTQAQFVKMCMMSFDSWQRYKVDYEDLSD